MVNKEEKEKTLVEHIAGFNIPQDKLDQEVLYYIELG